MKLLTEEEHNFLVENVKGIGNKEITELLNKEFNKKFTVQQIKGYKNNRHLSSGLTGQFVKGQKGWNKGLKWNDFMSKESQEKSRSTWFKKGNDPANMDPIGTEKWKLSHPKRNDEGFLYVKVQDKHGRFNWKAKHRLLWENAYGKIPKGYKVIFRDGNRHNITLENLALVSNSQMLILNNRNLIFEESELTDVGINIAKVIDKVNEKQKK